MRWLKILLLVNGIVFAYYAISNLLMPTSFFAAGDAADTAIAAVRVIGVLYAAIAVMQLGSWRLADRTAVRLIAIASLIAVAGFAAVAATQGSGSSTTFQQWGLVSAAGNVVIAALYAFLLYREQTEAR